MARAVLREIVFGLATTGLLMGCVDQGGKSGTGESAGLAAAPAKKKAGQEVEAPEVFQATDSALWDGRPSLGGIWVASPEVTNPERVVMFNPATGKSITGALFKRERDNPGPRLQLSSDAAEALGILAGAPTEIRVTALRKEKVEEPEVAAAPVDGATPDAAATDSAAPKGKDGDAAAIASAALAAVDGDKAAKPVATDPTAKDADPAAAAAAGAAAVAATAADGTAAVVDQTPKKKTWKERRAEAKAAREAKKKAAAEAKAAAAAAAAGTSATGTSADGNAVAAEGEAPTATPDAAAAAMAPIEAAPLDARSPEATAPAETKKTKRKVVGDAAAPAAVAAEAAPAPDAPVATSPARPIQVASFSKEDNAKRAAEALAKIGVTATPQKSEKDGKAVWGVVVMGDAAMLKKIKDAGFADAYFLK